MVRIVIIALIAGVISMSIVNTNMNAMAKSSHRDHGDNKSNDRHHGCVYQKHVKVDQKHVCIDHDNRSSDYPPEEIILSSPGSPQQQFYANRVPATGNP